MPTTPLAAPLAGRRPDPALLAAIAGAALAAGAVVMRIRAGDVAARTKPDASPVTAADLASEELLRSELARLLPGVPVIAEEAVAMGRGEAPADTFLLVDPLDGTREFLAANGEFTINVALVEHGIPTLGVIYAPAAERLYAAGPGAFRAARPPGATADPAGWETIRCREAPARGLVAVASRSHLDPDTTSLLDRLDVAERLSCGSALKFGLIAEGRADVYPRLSTVCEWDVAAGHALVTAAGGTVTAPDGTPLAYGRQTAAYRVAGFIARGRGVTA